MSLLLPTGSNSSGGMPPAGGFTFSVNGNVLALLFSLVSCIAFSPSIVISRK